MKTESSDVFVRAISRLIGWIYTLSWSASFYPQPLLNWRRKSTQGFAIDFPVLNLLGFICYTISQAAFLYSPLIRAQYATRHPASPEPTTRFNDFVFGAHGSVLVVLTYSQFYSRLWGFRVIDRQKMSPAVTGIIWGSMAAIFATIMLAFTRSSALGGNRIVWEWLDCIYTISYVKLLCSFVKYMPQVWLNYKRKSTKGWSIWQIIFDAIGGALSLTQLVIDASLQADWSGIVGNPVKFGLALLSLMFDSIFITQHYILYRNSNNGMKSSEDETDQRPLLFSPNTQVD